MLQIFKNGQTSVIIRVKLYDSSSAVGAGLTGLTNGSSGLNISTIASTESTTTTYTGGSTIQTITTLGTYAAPSASNCRFKEVDATNHPGIYEIQLADARYAVSNAKSLLVSLSGATNLQQIDFVVQLTSDDPYVAKPTNFTDLAITASTGLVTVGTNNDKTGYTVSTNNDKTGYALSATGSAALTESYAADGAAFTLNQAIYQIWSMLAEKNIVGTTLTTKKLDGSTTAMTFTLDSATTPSTVTRST